jgi:dihydrofolate synthase/folylpolyglutamate synthase
LLDFGYKKATEQLERRGFGIKPDLTRIQALAELLDHPERNYPSIQIAGTNGKSTTARMIGAILAAHGLSTGIYLSPHLQSVRERFLLAGPRIEGGIDRDIMSKDDFAATMEYLLPFVAEVENESGEQVTYHELTTAMAFEWMSDKSVGAAVLETGMGGRWDAASVAEPSVALLTHIEVDHRDFLGSTPLENAQEKVGIIDHGSVVVSAAQRPEVLELVEATAREHHAELKLYSRDFELTENTPAIGGRQISINGVRGNYRDLFVPLIGSHQGLNAAMAVAATEQFIGRNLEEDALRQALGVVDSPGRIEIVRRQPLVILDGAHNPHGAATLGPSLVEAFGNRRRIFVITMFKDKDISGVLEQLLPYADEVVFTKTDHPRAADPGELMSVASSRSVPVRVEANLGAAIDSSLESAEHNDMIVFTGSLWGVGEARDHLLGPVD